MSRADELRSNDNPVKAYLKWKSNEKKFEAYNRESKTSSLIDLPVSLTFLKTSSIIKGWSDANECGIYSNQVTSTQNEILTVRAGDVKIASGLYRDIKDVVKAAGGKYHLNVYCVFNGDVVVLELKGAALMQWMDFFKKNKKKLDDFSILIENFKEGKKGAVKYTIPEFVTGAKINQSEADSAYDAVKDYLSYKSDDLSYKTEEASIEEESDLPF